MFGVIGSYIKIRVRAMLHKQDGQGMVEYAMIVGLVAIGVIALLTLMGGQIQDVFTSITNALKGITGVRPS